MAEHIGRALALIGFGLLLGFVGFVWIANLFGVADERARRIVRDSRNQQMVRWLDNEPDLDRPMKNPGMKVGRYLAGSGFMLAGIAIIIAGGVYLFAGPE